MCFEYCIKREISFIVVKTFKTNIVLLLFNMVIKKGISLAAMERLLKAAGAQRVSENAKIALKEAMESYAEKVGENATRYAKHASRKTVKAEDVELAVKTK